MEEKIEYRRNILLNLIRAVAEITPIGKGFTFVENQETVSSICHNEDDWLDLVSAITDLIRDYT